jgi:hypothetical protein
MCYQIRNEFLWNLAKKKKDLVKIEVITDVSKVIFGVHVTSGYNDTENVV